MCPDRQLISLYMDGELPSPWKEKMKDHLESCPECRAVFSGYQGLKDCFQDLPQENIEAAGERVWKKLLSAELVFPENPAAIYKPNEKRIWKRSVSLPLPMAAAAAVLVIIVFFAIIGIQRGRQPPVLDSVAAVIPEYMQVLGAEQGMVPVQDMTGVLQYLSSQDYGDFMIIRLPETSSFSRVGEPALINAADYSRRTTYR